LFSAAGCSGTDSKEDLVPERNSCQYSVLNNKAASLPKDFLEKHCFGKEGKLGGRKHVLIFYRVYS